MNVSHKCVTPDDSDQHGMQTVRQNSRWNMNKQKSTYTYREREREAKRNRENKWNGTENINRNETEQNETKTPMVIKYDASSLRVHCYRVVFSVEVKKVDEDSNAEWKKNV